MENVSRRSLIKTAALGTAALAAERVAATAVAEEATSYEQGIEWSGLYDVVVIGMGIGGECAAIEASNADVSVLVLEKGPDGLDGGNTRYCHQYAIAVDDDKMEDARTYFRQIRGLYNYPTDEQIDGFVEGLNHNVEFFENLGAPIYTYSDANNGADFPQEYPEFEGAGCVYGFGVSPVMADGAMFKLLKKEMQGRDNVEIWFNAPATELIRDPETGVVIGVTAEVDGQAVNIRARNGVVLSSGGYENNPQMLQDYAAMPEAYPIACHFNTGDGQLMAMRIGAQMSAMHNVMCYINSLYADGVTAEWNSGTRFGKAKYTTSLIFVGADGTRFMNENFKARHGYMPWHGNFVRQNPTIPAWCVFDEKARKEGFFSNTYNNGSEEGLTDGHFVIADTLEELAEKIEVPAETLAATVARYNGFCEQGEDVEFHRDPEAMVALDEEGPFYAFRLVHSVLNTQGGPRRDANAQIVDVEGNPIPHLYGAGECGEMFTSCYQGSGNLGLGIVYGRLAGANAATPKDDGQPAADLAVVAFSPAVPEEPVYEAADNQRIGRTESHCGELVVRVTTEGDAISAVEILHTYDTPNIGLKALNQLAETVVGMTPVEVADVDTVTYATCSSKAFKEAIANAFEA